jgi:hypothetical protein
MNDHTSKVVIIYLVVCIGTLNFSCHKDPIQRSAQTIEAILASDNSVQNATAFTRSDLPILIDIVVNKSRPNHMRRRALDIIVRLEPNDAQIDILGAYVRQMFPIYKSGDADDICYAIGPKFAGMYQKGHNERMLQIHRKLYKDSICGPTCKKGILLMLTSVQVKENIPFFIEIFKDSGSNEMQRWNAAFGLGMVGNSLGIETLQEMANYLFEKDIYQGHLYSSVVAIIALEHLASKENNQIALHALQEMALKCCSIDYADFPYLENNSQQLFDYMACIPSPQNRVFFEKLSQRQCVNNRVGSQAIEVLDRINHGYENPGHH